MSPTLTHISPAPQIGRPQRNPNPPKHRLGLTPAPEPQHSALAPETAPWTSAPEGFAHWFNWGHNSIERVGDGNWTTLPPHILLTPVAIGERWGAPFSVIGLRFRRETNYFLIDIDAGSPYCNWEGLRDIRAALEDLGINETVLIQSSHSGGLHLYGFLPAPVPTFRLAQALTVAFTRADLVVAPGVLEIFPNCKAYAKGKPSLYNGHRLPLQPGTGSWLLDDDLAPFLGCESIDLFLTWANRSAAAVDTDLLNGALETARSDYKALSPKRRPSFGNVVPFSRPAPGQLSSAAAQWQADLQADIAQGWTGQSQTNYLLYRIAVHGRVFEKIDSLEKLAAYISATAQTMPGYAQFCRHQGEIDRRAMDWAKSIFGFYLPYCNVPERLLDGARQRKPAGDGPNNEEKRAECMNRVTETVIDLEASGRMPAGVAARRRLIAMLCHCSERTLAKLEYLPLWHPAYIDTAESLEAPEDVPADSIGTDVLETELDHTALLSGLAQDAQADSGLGSKKSSSLFLIAGVGRKDLDQASCTSPRRRDSDFSPGKTAQIIDLQAFRENRRHNPPPDPVPISAVLDLVPQPRLEPVQKPESSPPSAEDLDLGCPESQAKPPGVAVSLIPENWLQLYQSGALKCFLLWDGLDLDSFISGFLLSRYPDLKTPYGARTWFNGLSCVSKSRIIPLIETALSDLSAVDAFYSEPVEVPPPAPQPPASLDPFVAHAVALFHAGGFSLVSEWLDSLPPVTQAEVISAIQSAFSQLQEGRYE